MDLNDPRKRLQVLNNTNPSLRMSVAPQQQKISIAQPQAQPKITVPQSNPQPTYQAPAVADNQYKAIKLDQGKNKTIFGWNAAALLPKSLEKTYGVGTQDATFNNSDEFLKYFDTRDNEFQRAFVNKLKADAVNDPTAAKTLKTLSDAGRFKGSFTDFATGANDKLYGGISRGILRGTDFVLPGHNTFGLEKLADQQDPSKTGTQQYSTAGKVGEKVGNVEKGVFDIASLFAGAGAAEQAASKIPMFANTVEKLSQGGRIAQIAGKGLSIIPGSLAGSGVDALQTAGRGDKSNVGKNALVGLAADLALPVIGKGVSKFVYGLRGGEAGALNRFIKGLAKSDSADEIFKSLSTLNPEAADDVVSQVAQYISKEDSPEAIRSALSILDTGSEVGQQLAPGVYTAYSPNPDSLPEGLVPPHQAGTPNDRFPKSGQTSFAPITPEAQTMISDLEQRAMKTARPSGTTRVFQVSEGTSGNSDWVFDDADSLANWINGRTHPDMKVNFYDVPNESLIPATARGEHVFQVNGDPAALSKTKDIAEELRFTQANQNAKEAIKAPSLANKVAATASADSPDALTNMVKILAENPNKGQVRDILFGNGRSRTGLLEGLNLDNAAKNALVRDLTKETDPQRVTDRILQAIQDSNNSALTNTAEQVAQAAPTTGAAQAEQAVQNLPQQSGVADVATNAAEAAPAAQVDNVAATVNQNADAAVTGQQTAAQLFPNADPETQSAVQKVMDELNNAETAYKDVQKVRKAEKGARAGAMAPSYEAAGGGEQGFRSKLSSLKGKYSESGFNPIQADEAVQTTILNDIENSNLRDFEKLNTQNAMRKIWGANPEKPTASDINYIRKYFGEDMANAVQTAVEEGGTGWRDKLAQVAGTPRALMATGDLSMGFRQAAPLGTRMPKEWAVANKESVKYAGSKAYFDKEMKKMADSDYFEVIKDKMKVALTAADKTMEEAYAAADIAEAIPGVGRVVTASDRAYSGGLTKLRFEAAKKIVDSYGGVDGFLKFFEGNDKALTDLGEVINTFTGRGGKAGGLVEQHMKTLSTTLFAPRLWAAKLNSLNPAFYARLSPEARKLALQTQASFLTTAGSVLALASAAGAEVIWDPRSADFAKIKVGNTRYDILGGLQQNIRLGAQLVTGQKINSVTGELSTLGDGYTAPTRKDILLQAFENKENPLLSLATQLMEGKDAQGQPIDVTNKNPFENPIGQRLIPLGIQGAYETSKDTGSVAKGTAMNVPGFFGVGVQTYGNVASKDKGADGSYNGPVAPDMVTDKSGRVILDDKGRPVKVKIPKDATDLERQALIDDKRKAALSDQYRRTLSKEDQALMKLTDQQLSDYVDNGKIDQSRYDQIKQYQKNIENADGIKMPEGAKSKLAKDFFLKYNSLTKEGQKTYLSDTPDSTAKTITELLNKERSKGLSEFKPSNEISKAYAEYEDDLNSHPEYTEVDKRNKAKSFQSFAYKLNYSTDQRDVYNEGSSSDLRYLLDQKQVSKEDLDAAIKMDNELFNSGLTGSLKFSKKFRNEYGYAVPTGEGGPNAGSSSGSGDTTPRTGIGSLLPSFKTANQGGNTPSFSSKRRTSGISFKNVNLPSKSSKKVSIKL